MNSYVDIITHESAILKTNPLNDPYRRKLAVYLPPSYNTNAEKRYPVIYLLSGFMGFGTMFLSPQAWGYSLDERCDKLIADGKMKEAIIVMPDCFTKYGGSQYLNSSALGNYEDYIIKEIVPFIDSHYRTRAEIDHRAVMGKSSGGFGALRLAMKYPEVFSVTFCSAGDMYFEYAYKPDIPKCYNTVDRAGGLKNFLEKFFEAPKKTGDMISAINIIAMSAAYSPNLDNKLFGFDLPFDTKSGELKNDIWQRWLEHDPVLMIEKDRWQNQLRRLKHIFLECGSRDEYFLHIGARIFTQRLKNFGIVHAYEEFDDGHMGTSYRYDISLSKISQVIS
ncbi:esterase family protein [bacterium]|nr:esterase family protein [bacterium]